MLKHFSAVILCLFMVSGVFAAQTPAADTIQLTVINNSHMEIAYLDFTQPNEADWLRPVAADGFPTSFDIERPHAEENLATLLFQFKNGDKTGVAVLYLVRAPQSLMEFLSFAPEFIVTFYDKGDQTWAGVSQGINKNAEISYLYHSTLNAWGTVEPAAGIVFYQDEMNEEWDTYEKAQSFDTTVPTPWEHLYPGEMDDWLRSPLESRGFIVPATEIYNVGTWSHDEVGSFRLERLTPDLPKVSKDQLMVVKAFGDFGWGMLSYQTADQKWHFIEYGYDGWGAYGGMWYKIIDDTPSDYITYDPATVPWTQKR